MRKFRYFNAKYSLLLSSDDSRLLIITSRLGDIFWCGFFSVEILLSVQAEKIAHKLVTTIIRNNKDIFSIFVID